MIINTPPSNVNKEAKFGIIVNSIQNGVGIFTCTPKDERVKGGEQIKHATMFNQGGAGQNTQNSLRANILLQTPPFNGGGGCGTNFLGKTNLF